VADEGRRGVSGRIRQFKPELFSDPDMAALPFRTRWTYEALWSLADDSGWLARLDPVEIGHFAHGYESARTRERWVVEDLTILQERGFLAVMPCGHGHIPTLPRHQRVSKDRRVEMHYRSHETQCSPAAFRGVPRHSAEIPTGKERNVTVSNGSAGTLETVIDDGITEFRDKVPEPHPRRTDE
jgi:hypothetical protein